MLNPISCIFLIIKTLKEGFIQEKIIQREQFGILINDEHDGLQTRWR